MPPGDGRDDASARGGRKFLPTGFEAAGADPVGKADAAVRQQFVQVAHRDVVRGRDRAAPMPFGPYLASAGWIAMMWGNELVDGYLRISGLRH